MRLKRLVTVIAVAIGILCLLCLPNTAGAKRVARHPVRDGRGSPADPPLFPSPIKHVVVVILENHSFDNILGKFCVEVAQRELTRPGNNSRCDGATRGTNLQGRTTTLQPATNLVSPADHSVRAQRDAINSGKMNGFNADQPCRSNPRFCYSQYDPRSGPCPRRSCIPNLSTLATRYAVSDHTFELNASPSWAGHIAFAAASQDGFYGDNPTRPHRRKRFPAHRHGGWGCDSGDVTGWFGPQGKRRLVPSCIPNQADSLGPNWVKYQGPHAAYVPTIFDRLEADNLSWSIYGGYGHPKGKVSFQNSGWQWAICPTFAECLYNGQRDHLHAATQIESDGRHDRLPSFSIVTPTSADSEHNFYYADAGDNFLGQVIGGIQSGSDWRSTAVFVTYDDCGCFYDHVNPLAYSPQWGLRVPMVVVSPYVKLGYTDSNPATFAGILAFVEHTFGILPLNSADSSAYDYANSFCFSPSRDRCTRAGDRHTSMVTQRVPGTTATVHAEQVRADRDDT